MRIALAQLNTTVGDIAGNERLVLEAYRRGVEAQAELVLTPELSLTGYPPRDLLLRQSFIRANQAALDRRLCRRESAATRTSAHQCGGAAAPRSRGGDPHQDAAADLRCLR